MIPPPAGFHDVRDMQCAQALAQASMARKRLAPGAVLELLCNADDVTRDLLVWVKELGDLVVKTHTQTDGTRLWIRKRHEP